MEGKNRIMSMLVVGVLLAGGLVFAMREDMRVATRDVWERMTGKTVTVYDPDTKQEVVMPETSYAEETADDEDVSDEEDEEMIEDDEAVLQDEEAAAEAATAAYDGAWSADARGYLSVESQECPPWESCDEVKMAYFIVTDTKSKELAVYLGVPDGDAVRFPLGCDEGSTIQYTSYDEVASSKQRELPTDVLAALRASSAAAPVALRVSKAAWPEDSGTEGPVCVAPFFGYALPSGS